MVIDAGSKARPVVKYIRTFFVMALLNLQIPLFFDIKRFWFFLLEQYIGIIIYQKIYYPLHINYNVIRWNWV